MTQSDPNTPVTDCIIATIVGFMLPFFLAGAGGNQDVAKAAIRELLDAYNAGTPTELDLAGRIVGFSIVAMDNLRLSMAPDLSDTKVLRYRCNAVTLSRSSDTARKMLDALKAGREVKREVPRPSIAAAPPAPKPTQSVNPPLAAKLPSGGVSEAPMDIDAMKRDARIMMAAFSKNGVQPASIPMIPNAAAAIDAALRAGASAIRRTAGG
jgi:hypothetical protein